MGQTDPSGRAPSAAFAGTFPPLPPRRIRLHRGPRAKVLIDGDTMVFLDLDQDHDKLYGRP